MAKQVVIGCVAICCSTKWVVSLSWVLPRPCCCFHVHAFPLCFSTGLPKPTKVGLHRTSHPT